MRIVADARRVATPSAVSVPASVVAASAGSATKITSTSDT
jgi:hypothetical protein